MARITLCSSGKYHIDTISVWITSRQSFSLFPRKIVPEARPFQYSDALLVTKHEKCERKHTNSPDSGTKDLQLVTIPIHENTDLMDPSILTLGLVCWAIATRIEGSLATCCSTRENVSLVRFSIVSRCSSSASCLEY